MKNLIMNIFSGKIRAVFYAGAFFITSLAGVANADIQSSSDLLKACLDRQINAELDKEKPNKETVLNNCAKELKALELQLPAGAKEAIKHDLDHGILEQFKSKAS